jgi:hypothetical protein
MTKYSKADWALFMRQLFQSLIVLGVMATDIHWGWTDNHYLAALIGGLTAWGATAIADQLAKFWRSQRRGGPSC